ncbi:diadenosine tetraphosphate (Ap4A) HIT family hydrolase [Pseudomonas duriflava]|uniref:Diadenosine tetraphosphate (Ap4A) HIT family hydrolase n=1 Tax=Pseudomonas duriflava TaxID=459528 RepID=A0A562QIZ1_9PSED|nr:HIT family protein [Pseudomonas duriflava]TWI56727.1 diadenosine tetraphosphate (Ap4A) HIT family hydrolase [Pseudomonas duriflava]
MSTHEALSATLQKFGAPETVVREYEHWTVLLRPHQVTLGALVLIAKEAATALPQLSPAAFSELKQVTDHIEQALQAAFSYDKVNYLMLMMVDPDVHFHVIPRYNKPRIWAGQEFVDVAWPGPPQLSTGMELSETAKTTLRNELIRCWPC